MKKMFTLCAALALTLTAQAATYRVTLFQASTVNGTTLQPGEYKVDIGGDKVQLQNGKTKVEVPAKQEMSDAKFSNTSVRYKVENGQSQIQEIRLGGTKTKLVFAPASAAGL